MTKESLYFDWLTYSWLQENIFLLGFIILFSIAILLLFPLLLGFDMKKEINRKNKNNKLKD